MMESNTSQALPKERSRQPPYPRAPSRASTASSTNNSQMGQRSTHSSSSHLNSSQQTSTHPSHRFHHTSSARSITSTRPSSRLSKDSAEDTRQPAAPVSSFLQERLQRGRQLESTRSLRRGSTDMSTVGDVRDVQSSPVRGNMSSSTTRPQSSGGDEPLKKKGMGLKEMEQAVSTLHKQNFDLKLELYHRRERMVEIEERLETLEAEREQMVDLNDNLMEELEKRDKAVEEAVAMIVSLEARVDELLNEREMVRQVELDGQYLHSRSTAGSDGQQLTPRMRSMELAKEDDSRAVARMPSFVSERSEQTEHLREVYLGFQERGPSVMSLRRISAGTSNADPGDINRITSPSLSVLSESSFTSIYGQQNGQDQGLSPPPADKTSSDLDGTHSANTPTPVAKRSRESWKNEKIVTPTRMAKSSLSENLNSITNNINKLAQMQCLNDILDVHSPLQQLQMLEKKLKMMDNGASRPSTASQKSDHQKTETHVPSPSRQSKPPLSHIKTKQEKRDALRRVLTSGPTTKDLAQSHTLPPTPDTISTSTLRRYKTSNDNMVHQADSATEKAYSDSVTSRVVANEEAPKPFFDINDATVTQPPSITAFESRRQVSSSSYFDNLPILSQRPRSAGETTVSRRRGNGWDSDDDSDLQSIASSFDDYWIRESKKPEMPHSRAPRAPSPDLFNFPAGANTWATEDMFGALRGNGFISSPVSALKRDPLDEMVSTPQTAIFNSIGGPPPPPNRRSSLHARTGSSSGLPPISGKLRKTPTRANSKTRTRSNSIDSAYQVPPPKFSQPEQQQQPAPPVSEQKRNYPPISGQPRMGGLNRLFRRSGSYSDGTPASAPPSARPTETTFSHSVSSATSKSSTAPTMVPVTNSDRGPAGDNMQQWAVRAPGVADDGDYGMSATPPPILRKPRISIPSAHSHVPDQGMSTPRQGDMGSAVNSTPGKESIEPNTPSTPMETSAGITGEGANGSSTPNTGGRRRWLNLGRMGSAKK